MADGKLAFSIVVDKRNHLGKSDINTERIFILQDETLKYGQTPVAICRSQFADIAKEHNLSLNQMAEVVLKMSVNEQLELLRNFYAVKHLAVGQIYNGLINTSNDGENGNRDDSAPLKVQVHARERHCKIPANTDSEPKMETSAPFDIVITPDVHQATKESPSRDSNIEEVASNSPLQTENVVEQINTCDNDNMDGIQILLFGKMPANTKPPPKRKNRIVTSKTCVTTLLSEGKGEQPLQETSYQSPQLTFDQSHWSPARQRSLLEILQSISECGPHHSLQGKTDMC